MTIIDNERPHDGSAGEEALPLRYVYSESYVRAGKRKTATVNFWAEGLIVVRTLAPEEAPPAYRIVGESGCEDADYTIREHYGSLFWPLLESGRILSSARFRKLAAGGDRMVLDLLHIGGRSASREDRTTHYRDNPIKEHLGDTRADLQTQAQAATADIVFCGDIVLVEAGTPIYYVLPVRPTAPSKVIAGPSKVERLSDGSLGVAGPSGHAAVSCMRANQAFGIHEINAALASPALAPAAGNVVARLEHLSSSEHLDRAIAALACAREFVDLAFGDSTLNHPICRLLRTNVPSFQQAGYDFRKFRRIPSEIVLDEIASIKDPKLIQAHPSRITNAAQLLSRLRSVQRPVLSQEEEAALARIA